MNSQSPFVIAAAVAVCSVLSAAQAGDAVPLSADELARCASQVQQLRTESARLLGDNARLDVQRASIFDRRRQIDAEAAAQSRDDLAKGMGLSERRQGLNAEVTSFNARIDQIRRDIAAINQTKLDYEQSCAQRPYRRRDLEQLPQAAQDAMRAGLADVEVPYIENATTVSTEAAGGK
ncbi:MAG: hypothetical protein WC809_12640 [Sinimarinibacterium sp.]